MNPQFINLFLPVDQNNSHAHKQLVRAKKKSLHEAALLALPPPKSSLRTHQSPCVCVVDIHTRRTVPLCAYTHNVKQTRSSACCCGGGVVHIIMGKLLEIIQKSH